MGIPKYDKTQYFWENALWKIYKKLGEIDKNTISRSNHTMAVLEDIHIALRQLHFCSIKTKIKKANHIEKLIDLLAASTINSTEQRKSLALYSNKEKIGVENRLSKRKIHRIISFVKESTQTEQRYIKRSLFGRRLFYCRHWLVNELK